MPAGAQIRPDRFGVLVGNEGPDGRRLPRHPGHHGVPEQIPRDDILGEEPAQSHLIGGPRISSLGESCTTESGPEPSLGPGPCHCGVRLNEKKFRVTLMVMPLIETDSETAIVGDRD